MDSVTLRGDIPGLARAGMHDADPYCPGTISMVYENGRCAIATGGKIEWRTPTLDLLDPLTLQATVAWIATRLLGREVEPHECIGEVFGRRVRLEIRTKHGNIRVTDWPDGPSEEPDPYFQTFNAPAIFAHIPANLAGTKHGLALAVQAVALAIHEGRIGPWQPSAPFPWPSSSSPWPTAAAGERSGDPP